MLKKVIYPLYVPVGNYCYEGIDDVDTMCPHLVMDGGSPTCLINFEPEIEPESDGLKVLKDVSCLELENM